ncbi:MAG: hypothetical protein Q9188_003239 [Gyalolechia gomerana]
MAQAPKCYVISIADTEIVCFFLKSESAQPCMQQGRKKYQLRAITALSELIDIPLTLNPKEELAVEQLLEKTAAVLAMIEEEETALQVALQKANENDAAGALEEKRVSSSGEDEGEDEIVEDDKLSDGEAACFGLLPTG